MHVGAFIIGMRSPGQTVSRYRRHQQKNARAVHGVSPVGFVNLEGPYGKQESFYNWMMIIQLTIETFSLIPGRFNGFLDGFYGFLDEFYGFQGGIYGFLNEFYGFLDEFCGFLG